MEKEGEHEYYLFTYHPLKADNSFALKKEFKEYLEKFKSRRAGKKKAREEKRAAKKAAKQENKTDPDDAAQTEQEL